MKLEITLKDFAPLCIINEQEFEYAGINGFAELIGWQIILFRTDKALPAHALVINNVDSKSLLSISNKILSNICFNVRMGDDIDKIRNCFGKESYVDDVLENIVRCNYLVNENYFISFGLKDNKLSNLEIILNKEIITARCESFT